MITLTPTFTRRTPVQELLPEESYQMLHRYFPDCEIVSDLRCLCAEHYLEHLEGNRYFPKRAIINMYNVLIACYGNDKLMHHATLYEFSSLNKYDQLLRDVIGDYPSSITAGTCPHNLLRPLTDYQKLIVGLSYGFKTGVPVSPEEVAKLYLVDGQPQKRLQIELTLKQSLQKMRERQFARLMLDKRIVNVLHKYDIDSVADLRAAQANGSLERIAGIGSQSQKRIERALRDYYSSFYH